MWKSLFFICRMPRWWSCYIVTIRTWGGDCFLSIVHFENLLTEAEMEFQLFFIFGVCSQHQTLHMGFIPRAMKIGEDFHQLHEEWPSPSVIITAEVLRVHWLEEPPEVWYITLSHSAVVDLIWSSEFKLVVSPLPGEPNHLGHYPDVGPHYRKK